MGTWDTTVRSCESRALTENEWPGSLVVKVLTWHATDVDLSTTWFFSVNFTFAKKNID